MPPDVRTGATIVLMGLRGSGKTSVSKLLAEALGTGVVDLDDRTASSLGATTCAEAIDRVGWEAFRETEAHELARALGEHPGVLALGGGTPTAPGASETLGRASASGVTVVYLHTPPEVSAARVEGDRVDRPRLAGATAFEEARALYAARDPLYRGLATLVVETSGRTPGDIADDLAKRVGDG